MTEKVNLTINGQAVSVDKGTTVYQAAKAINAEIPIFCYQDRMPPFGACRMCLVEVEKMGKLQASCTLLATEGMVVKTESAKAVDGRKGILELLLINHPLDCPICDRGGECPLQENALQHGPGKSEFFEEKRKFKKPLPMGPVLMLDRERCIVCARCTRFGEVLAGDHALQMIDRGFKTEVGTKDHQPIDSKFIGNTIQICPVGALTSQVYRFRARPWDNEAHKSTCTLCPVGCSMYFDSRDGQIMRTRSSENKDVNDIWLCDKGFFGYQFTSDSNRLTKPLIRKNGKLEEATYEEAFSLIGAELQKAKENKKIAAFGGNPLTTEENYLFQKLMRDVLKVENLDHHIEPFVSSQTGGGMEISVGECEELSYVFLFGLDLTEEFPVIWLRLRQAINKGAKVIFTGHYKPEIATYLTENFIHAPGSELEVLKKYAPEISTLNDGKKGAFFVGSQYLSSKNCQNFLNELTALKKNHSNFSLNIMEGNENSKGAAVAGMTSSDGLNALSVLKESANNGWDLLYVAGANPAAKFSKELFSKAREKLKFLVVQDIFLTETAMAADVVLPTLCYVEKGGSFINIEGRLQKLQPGKELPEGVLSDGEIFEKIAKELNASISIDSHFQALLEGVKVTLQSKPAQKIKVETQEGVLSATFSRKLFDHGVRMKHNQQLVQLAKHSKARLNNAEAIKYHIRPEDKIKISANGNEIEAYVEIDDGVADGTIVLPLGFAEVAVQNLSDELFNGLKVTINKVI